MACSFHNMISLCIIYTEHIRGEFQVFSFERILSCNVILNGLPLPVDIQHTAAYIDGENSSRFLKHID